MDESVKVNDDVRVKVIDNTNGIVGTVLLYNGVLRVRTCTLLPLHEFRLHETVVPLEVLHLLCNFQTFLCYHVI